MKIIPQIIPEVRFIQLDRFSDQRGFFGEVFREDLFCDFGLPPFVQENLSRSKPGVVRGLHYQLNPKAQGKLVSCLEGTIIDMALDIRQGSPTYGQHIEIVLSSLVGGWVYIPEGFAHGFSSIGTSDALVYYKTTNYYSPAHDRCINYSDPDLEIIWGLRPETLLVSDKDAAAPLMKNADNNFWYKG